LLFLPEEELMEDKQNPFIPPTEPAKERREHWPSRAEGERQHDRADDEEEPTGGGSQSDRTRHSGTRDVTEGTSGGTGTETGGSRNYRSGTGATGGDIGNRPE
jgi:hypothetical protein